MDALSPILPLYLHGLNNAEFEFFARGTVNNLLNTGYAKLGVKKEQFDPYNLNTALLGDIVSQSLISDLTARIAEADHKCDALLQYLFMLLDAGRHSPVEADRLAYISLYNGTKVYRGIAKLPQLQQITQTKGLVQDVSSAGLSEHIIRLNLTSLVQEIDNANLEYSQLVDQRRNEQAKKKLPPARTVRREMTEQYRVLMATVEANHLVAPTADTAGFIEKQNALIAEVTARYNLRMGLLHHYKEQEEGTEPGSPEPPAEVDTGGKGE